MKKLLILAVLFALPATAQVRVPLQGHLTDSGQAVSGPVALEVRVLDNSGTVRSCEVFDSVSLTDGVFNLLLGDTLNDCGGPEPTEVATDIFQLGPATVRVRYNDVDFDFPVGDVPSAGHAQTCDSASVLGGYTANQLLPDPRVLRAPEGELANAIADAAALGGPVLIELGPGLHSGSFTIPAGVTLRGAGQSRSTLSGSLVLEGNARAESLSVEGAGAVVVELRPVDYQRTELIDVAVTAFGNASGTAVRVSEGGASARVFIERSRLVSFAEATAVGLQDDAGVRIEMRDTEIRITNPADVGYGIRVGTPGADVTFFDLDVRGSKISASVSNDSCAGVEVRSSSDGSAEIQGTSISAQCTDGLGVAIVNAGSLRVRESHIYAEGPLYAGLNASIFVGGSMIDKNAGAGAMLAPGSSPVTCVASYNGTTAGPLDASCAIP